MGRLCKKYHITHDEMEDLFKQLRHASLKALTSEKVQELFDNLDAEKSGRFQTFQVKAFFDQLDRENSMTTKMAEKLMRRTDSGESGYVDFNQFLVVIAELQLLLTAKENESIESLKADADDWGQCTIQIVCRHPEDPSHRKTTYLKLRSSLVEDEAEDWVDAMRQCSNKFQVWGDDATRDVAPVAKSSKVRVLLSSLELHHPI
jgi:Ca2+-binding EF-hand superfamily protein